MHILPRLPRLLASLLLVALAGSIPLSGAARADELQDQNTRDRIKQREEWARQDVERIEQEGERDAYAAIAYSPSTGKYGYSYNFETLADARSEALKHCPVKDAKLVAWASNGWYCALALGKDGYGHGSGRTAAAARAMALSNCRKFTTDCKVVVCVYSRQ